MASVTAYPAHLETDVVLRDGSTVRIRPARPEDAEPVEDYLLGLSEESRRLRFWGPSVDIRGVAAKAVDVDYVDHLTLLAFSDRRVVAGAQYIRVGGYRAEVSVSVADELQGKGLGSLLIAHLAQAADEAGIRFFFAEVLPENHRMIDVFRRTGFDVAIHAKPGEVEVEFPTTITEEAVETYEERERIAAANAVRALLEPTSVAVIGASRDPSSIGGRLFHNLLSRPFTGVVYPVNPTAEAVQGVPAYASIADVPGPVDVAFIAVPAAYVIDIATACGEKGVHGLVVISAGFGESGAEGRERQSELLEVCRAAGMRLVGPNCMGVVNTVPRDRDERHVRRRLAARGQRRVPVAERRPGHRRDRARRRSWASGSPPSSRSGTRPTSRATTCSATGTRTPRTDVIMLYLESFGNPKRFGRLARRIGRTKPIVAVKSGRSVAGARAASSHTGALLASSDVDRGRDVPSDTA